MVPRYDRPHCKPVHGRQFDVIRLSTFGPGTSSECYRTVTARTLDEVYGKHDIYGLIENGRQSRICYSQRRAQNQEKSSTSKHCVQCKAVCVLRLLGQSNRREIILSITSHKAIPVNEKADQAAKEALDEDISTTERYPPDDLKKWLTEEDFKKKYQKYKNENNEMKERKPDIDIKKDTKGMPGK
jgi:hypothetical protein